MNISVIIPAYNAEKTILETLAGLEGQTLQDFEVLVVDDGSTDSTSQRIAAFQRRSSLVIKLIQQDNAGPAQARNTGVEVAQGKIVVFLDSDCIPPPTWLDTMISALQGGIVGCGCGYKVRNVENLVARYVDHEIAWRHHRMLGKKVDALGSYSTSLIREVFLQAGGFDIGYREANAEDFALAFKVRHLGYDLTFTDKTFVCHYHPSSLRKYLRQQYRRGYWRLKLYLDNRGRLFHGEAYTGHETQIQFVLANLALLSLPLAVLHPLIAAVGCIGLYLSNSPLGIWAGKKEKKFLFLAPVLASLRSLAGTFGVYSYFLYLLKHRWETRNG
jgi:glycosyltransferase involved in cell wall biosynthesis